MEFWGVEVKAGETFKVELEEGKALHLSQACVGEIKKDKGQESICLFLNCDGKKLVLGTLFSDKLPQQIFDLVFDREVELSHNWKNGSVYFYGYTANNHYDQANNHYDQSASEDDIESSESDEDIPLLVPNGGPTTQVKQEKSAEGQKGSAGKDSAAGKQKVKIVEPKKDADSEDDDDSSDEDAMSEDDSDDDEDKKSESDEKDADSDEDEETPVQVKSSKKRTLESASKTPVPDKKPKLITPQKTDGKKSSVHVDTPHPSKQTGKTPATKPSQQTPKTDGSHSCKACKKTFKSEGALDSHNKAKHRVASK